MTGDTDLAKRVCDLEERVNYLERELDISVEEERFERRMERIAPTGSSFEVSENNMGFYVGEIDILPTELPHIVRKVDEIDGVGWEVRDSSEESITVAVREGLINQ